MREIYEIAAQVKEKVATVIIDSEGTGGTEHSPKEEDYGMPQRNRHERRKLEVRRRRQ
jgi:hypothetical protein